MRSAVVFLIIAFTTTACQSILSKDVPSLIRKSKHSLVRVVVLKINQNGEKKPHVLGTGFVVEPGVAATAAHVVKDLPEGSFFLVPADQENFIPNQNVARIAVLDLKHDLVLLESPALDNMPSMQLYSTQDVKIGEDVLILGFPLYDATLTATKGMLSATSKKKLLEKDSTITNMFKIDASINKGNSGGPIIHIASGKVIGVACLKEGALSKKLNIFKRKTSRVRIILGGDDPIALLKETLTEMENNLQLGLGYGVNVSYLIDLLEKRN